MASNSVPFEPELVSGNRIRLHVQHEGRPKGTQGTFKWLIDGTWCEVQFDKDDQPTVVPKNTVRKIHFICQCIGEMVILIYDAEAANKLLKAGTSVLVLSAQGHTHIQVNKRKHSVPSNTKVVLL